LAARASGAFGWRLVELAGEGATSAVWRAEKDGVVAALKVASSADGFVGREAVVLAGLQRRWGPALLDCGSVPDGASGLRPGARFVATDWVDGEPLGSAKAKARNRTELAAIVAHGVGRALDELHAMGVRHGDVKPANVLVGTKRPTRDSAEERGATLIDMGLAVRVTGEGASGGTMRYLAPELRRGEAATPAADLYALGLVLAEVLVPGLAEASDPVAALANERIAAPFDGFIAALLAAAPGARPSAGWLADRAARFLELAADAGEAIAARRARVRRAYLAVHGDEVRAGASIAAAITGEPRAWLDEAVALADRLSSSRGQDDVKASIEPLDSLGTARWVVALVGPAASSWALPERSDSVLAERLLALSITAAPEAWALDDLSVAEPDQAVNKAYRATSSGASPGERWLTLTRELLAPRPRAESLAAAEDAVAEGGAPASLVLDLGNALLRRGEIGRAYATVSGASRAGDDAELTLLGAELARRRGDAAGAASAARRVVGPSADGARALLARLAWDAGSLDTAEQELGDARGAAAAEVRGLLAYSRGEHERGLRVVASAMREADGPLAVARLEGTRGMLEHVRGRARESLSAFASAADLATRAGAVIEEATYLTGLAASAVDAGDVARGLAAATRAALLWERLDRPALAARALLGRAAAYALVGASHHADDAAKIAISRALRSGDTRALAYARWAIVEVRAPGDVRARDEVRAADDELQRASDEDRIRSAARVLVWAEGLTSAGSRVDVEAIDARASSSSATARWEWWGARAAAALATRASLSDGDGARRAAAHAVSPRVLAEVVAVLDVAAPLGSRGPALAAGARLAAELGDGDIARRLETARRAAADALRDGCPPEHHAALVNVPWARSSSAGAAGDTSSALGSAQVAQLDAIVRSLASRDRLKPLLEQVLDTMVLWTGVERGLLLLRAPDGGLVPRVARNLARRDLRGEQLALSMGLAKRAMEERQAVCATDAYAQVGDLHASVHALRLRSVLAVPLVARGDVLGVVYLDDRVRRGAFGDAELGWVRLVASQAALAIADARDQALLRRAVRRAERANAKLAAELGLREAELASARAELAQGSETRFRYDEIAGRSEPMRALLRLVDRVTASDVPVLLSGESGTGKELVARAIHANGARSTRPFVSENCGSVPEPLLESTLFGHVRGAFTGASSTRAGLFDVADGGTLLLDEIGEMPLSMQTKLLRVLQNGEVRPVGGEKVHHVDVRIIGATHRDLEAMVAAGTFREDLFYRLNVVSVRVPALRERAADIPLLVAHFVEKYGEPGRKVKVTRAAMDRLVAFSWPGNVRQLENEIRRAFVLADDRIDVTELSDEVSRGGPNSVRNAGLGLKARVDALEVQLVKDALERTKGNQTRAAEALGISRFGLQKMMRRLGIRTGTS
jgi:transcriptional regulator with GAF, ATPase, and Fis domain